jgi:hypothetical protein
MGREAICTCQWAGISAEIKALIEPPELIIRGEFRRRLPLAQLEDIRAEGDKLRFTFQGESVSIALGSAMAAKWAKAMTAEPATLAKKLGITPDTRVQMIGPIDDEALREALTTAKQTVKSRGDLILARVDSQQELAHVLKHAAAELANNTPIWFVYPKGRGHALGEGDVRAMALASGIVDTKVAAVSATLTALRFVKRRR